ncbi:hypothetical protein C4784_27435, partial [Salmonella enterica subsp. enterica serovar Gaminara]
RAEFLCVDFRHTLRAQHLLMSNDTVIYCDPPYLPESKTADFRGYTAARICSTPVRITVQES